MDLHLHRDFSKNWSTASWSIIRKNFQKTAKNAKSGVTLTVNISATTKDSENTIAYLECPINCLSDQYTQVGAYLHSFTLNIDVEVGQNTKK